MAPLVVFIAKVGTKTIIGQVQPIPEPVCAIHSQPEVTQHITATAIMSALLLIKDIAEGVKP